MDLVERSLVSFRYASPLRQAAAYENVVQNALGYDSLEMLAALYEYKGVSARVLDGFIGQFRRQLFVEGLFAGSISSQAVRDAIPAMQQIMR